MDWQNYLQKGQGSLRIAEVAFEHQEYNSCVSRCYYATFRHAIAALLKLTDYRRTGMTWNHGEVQAQFNLRLIQRRKLISSEFASTLQDLLAKRELADYEEESVGQKTVQRALKAAQDFTNAVRRILADDPQKNMARREDKA